MNSIYIEFLENNKVADGILEYNIPKAVDGEITVNASFPDKFSNQEKYVCIKSSNENRVIYFGKVNAVIFVLKHIFNYEDKITLAFQAGDDNVTEFEKITINRS